MNPTLPYRQRSWLRSQPGRVLRRRRTAFTQDAAVLAEITGHSWDHIWLLDESGSPVNDRLGSENLAQLGTVTYQQGPSLTNKRHVACNGGGQHRLESSGSSFLDLNGSSWALAMFFRVASAPLATSSMCGNRTAAVGNAGWESSMTNTGTLSVNLDHGAANTIRSITGNHADNNWHLLHIVVDELANTLGAFTDLTKPATLALGTGGTNSERFGLGSAPVRNGVGIDIAWAAVAIGANAEGQTSAVTTALEAWLS